MVKNCNWFGETVMVKATTVRTVRFSNVARGLVPGAGAALDTVYIERERAGQVKKIAVAETPDFVLRLVRE